MVGIARFAQDTGLSKPSLIRLSLRLKHGRRVVPDAGRTMPRFVGSKRPELQGQQQKEQGMDSDLREA